MADSDESRDGTSATTSATIDCVGHARGIVWVVLGIVVVVHLTVNALLPGSGSDETYRESPPRFAVEALCIGAVLAQPMLLAIVAVLWPAPRLMRTSGAIVLLLLMLYAWLIHEERISYAALESTFMPTIAFLVYQVPLRLARRWRGWRMLPPSSLGFGPGKTQFSVRTLLAVVVMVAVLLAIGPVVVPPLMWSSSVRGLWRSLLEEGMGGLMFAIFFIPAIPILPLCLGTSNKTRAGVVALTFILAAVSVFYVIGAIFDPDGSAVVYVIAIVFGVLGAIGSISISLLVMRWSGFRLVRASPKGNHAGVVESVGTIVA